MSEQLDVYLDRIQEVRYILSYYICDTTIRPMHVILHLHYICIVCTTYHILMLYTFHIICLCVSLNLYIL